MTAAGAVLVGLLERVVTAAGPRGPRASRAREPVERGVTAILDADSFGRLYVSPMELRSFEADGGLSNKQNVRLECNAGYAVERLTAAVRIV